jgi:hypothetical protein
MAEALNVLEKHNDFHGDIKPRDIFLCEDGSFKLGWRCFMWFWDMFDLFGRRLRNDAHQQAYVVKSNANRVCPSSISILFFLADTSRQKS